MLLIVVMDHCVKSFSAVNMCRFVILAVIAASLFSCVLAEPDKPKSPPTPTGPPQKPPTPTGPPQKPPTPTGPPQKPPTPTNSTLNHNKTGCANTTEMREHRRLMMNCFNSIVQYHLNPNATLLDKDCTNVTVFGQKLNAYFTEFSKACYGFRVNTMYILKLIEYSLSNNSFKTFYENVWCLEKVEYNISNVCVKSEYFNITETEKHLKWYMKGALKYDKNTCWASKTEKDCVALNLQQCPHTMTDYVVSLFEYSRNLGNCSNFSDPPVLPSPKGNGTTESSTWLTTPVIITLGIGGAVVVGAIITIIVIKNK